MSIKQNWKAQPQEEEKVLPTGEQAIRVSIQTAETPFGTLWIGAPLLINITGQAIYPPTFTIKFGKEIIATGKQTSADAVLFAEKWYSDRAIAVAAQVAADIANEAENTKAKEPSPV
jgi:hypothetical protein